MEKLVEKQINYQLIYTWAHVTAVCTHTPNKNNLLSGMCQVALLLRNCH